LVWDEIYSLSRPAKFSSEWQKLVPVMRPNEKKKKILNIQADGSLGENTNREISFFYLFHQCPDSFGTQLFYP